MRDHATCPHLLLTAFLRRPRQSVVSVIVFPFPVLVHGCCRGDDPGRTVHIHGARGREGHIQGAGSDRHLPTDVGTTLGHPTWIRARCSRRTSGNITYPRHSPASLRNSSACSTTRRRVVIHWEGNRSRRGCPQHRTWRPFHEACHAVVANRAGGFAETSDHTADMNAAETSGNA
jgi:hypothetical protein